MKKLTTNVLVDFIQDIEDLGENVTKTNLKTLIRGNGYSLNNLSDLFTQLNLQHTGKYTTDNHRIWVRVPAGKHLSKTKNQVIPIKDMPKPYLKNAIVKYIFDNGAPDIWNILTDSKTELHKMLQAYFTWEIRNSI